MPPARKPAKPDPHEGEIGWYDADGVWHEGLKPLRPDLETLIASAHPAGGVPEPVDVPLLNPEEESRLAGVRARARNGHADHRDARFLLELLDRYRA